MSNSERNQAAEEQAFRNLMEGHQENEFLDDDGGEDMRVLRCVLVIAGICER